jgi:hypothetical protein
MIVCYRHDRAAEAIRSALACGDAEAWKLARRLLHLNLDAGEMECIALTAAPRAGFPPVPLFNPMEDARLWAAAASREELRAYLLAAFKALPCNERRDFVAYAQGRATA